MADDDRELERIGEPSPPLSVDPQTVTQGQVVHIRVVGPPGGRATAECVPVAGPEAGGLR